MELVASAASARQILAHLDALGVDERTLDVGHVDPALRRSSGPVQVSARLSFDLLEAAARRLGRPDFGLQHGLWLNLRCLDSISLLWDHAGSVAEWYGMARRYVHLENNAVGYDVAQEGEDVALFRSFYRSRVEFDAPRNALVVRRTDFEQPLPRHNPELVTYFEQQLKRQIETRSMALEDLVHDLLLSRMAGTPPSLEAVAGQLGMTPRTLQRRLKSVGVSYGGLLAQVRTEIAAAHRRAGRPTTLTRLAYELGLSDATSASRFLRRGA